MEFVVHQLGLANRRNCAWRVIYDWSFEIALGGCHLRLKRQPGSFKVLVTRSTATSPHLQIGIKPISLEPRIWDPPQFGCPQLLQQEEEDEWWGDIPLKHEFRITNWIVHKFLAGHNFASNLSNSNFFPKSISLTFKPTTTIKFHCANVTAKNLTRNPNSSTVSLFR